MSCCGSLQHVAVQIIRGRKPGLIKRYLLSLIVMAFIDQEVQRFLIESTQEQRNNQKERDSLHNNKEEVFEDNCERAKIIFRDHGFPGFDLVGEKSSKNYWLIVQHCDNHLEFQQTVLTEMKKHVDNKNASGRNYAYLTDRVRINSGQPQLYGTQVQYDTDKGIAYPKELESPEDVDNRRLAIEMEPLDEYLDRVTTYHRAMNRERYEKLGILEPNPND